MTSLWSSRRPHIVTMLFFTYIFVFWLFCSVSLSFSSILFCCCIDLRRIKLNIYCVKMRGKHRRNAYHLRQLRPAVSRLLIGPCIFTQPVNSTWNFNSWNRKNYKHTFQCYRTSAYSGAVLSVKSSICLSVCRSHTLIVFVKIQLT